MSKNTIESMHNFKYFVKLRKTKTKTASEFFSSFFSSHIPKKDNQRKYKMNIFHYKDITATTPEEVLINELKKPIAPFETNLLQLSYNELNSFLNNSNNHYNMERNINTMLNIIKRNKRCLRYFIFNSLSDQFIRLLLAFSTHEYYVKGQPIYKNNTKANSFYLVIRGKVSLRTLNQEKIKNDVINKSNDFLTLYNNIEIEDKFNGKYNDENDDKISINNFISKSNIIINQQDDNNIKISSLFIDKKNMKINYRRSFTKDYNLFIKELNQSTQKYIEDKLLIQNLTELQRNLSSEIKSYVPGDFFGEWDLILDKPHQETAFAQENTDLMVLNKKYFDRYFLKQLIKIDNERRLFLTKRIEFLHINNVINLKPEFYDKDKVIYTQFDFAKEFYIIYKGRGALKQIKNGDCKKKSEVIFHKNDMKTLCFVDKGCVVGLEACKDGRKQYDNNFVILEDNTILYSIKMKGVNYDNYLKKKNRMQLKKELGALYLTQNNFLPNTNLERKKLSNDEMKLKKKEDRINNIFYDAKEYFWRTMMNEKKMNIKIKKFGNINDDINYYFSNSNSNKLYSKKKSFGKINLKKLFNLEYSPCKRKSQTRNNPFKYLTSINKKSKDISLTNISFPEFDEERKKNRKNINTVFNSLHSLNTELNYNHHFSENLHKNKNKEFYLKGDDSNFKESILSHNKFLKGKKSLTLKNFKSNNFLNDENNIKDNHFNKFYSFDNNNIQNKKIFSLKNKKYSSYLFFRSKKKIRLDKTIVNEYITKMARISNQNNINYNSGHFRIPLIGVN